jgi:vacuolar iron transporter family protein
LAVDLSGAIHATSIMVIVVLVEIAAGSIAMGLGGNMAASSVAEH